MKEIKKDPRLFKKTQNILRNLGTHKSILKLLTVYITYIYNIFQD